MPLDAANASPAIRYAWRPQPGPQTALLSCPADEVFFGGARGGGKRLWVGTPVPVPLTTDPTGYKTMGSLAPGDFVLSPRGEPVEVIGVSPILPAPDSYEVEFDTGEVVLADAEHLWATMTARDRKRLARLSDGFRARRRAARPSRAQAEPKKPWVARTVTAMNQRRLHVYAEAPTAMIRTTAQIAASLMDGREVNHSVEVTQAIALPDAALPICPYLFGLWLGDGKSASGVVGMAKEDFDAIAPSLPAPASSRIDPRPAYRKPFVVCRFAGLTAALRRLGVLGDKHIPPLYLRASVPQRMALLQGILDSDGHCDNRGQIEVGFSNRALMDGVLDLLSGLGVKARITEKRAKLNGIDHGPAWRAKFVAPFPAFRLPRKAQRQKLDNLRPTTRRRYIVAVRRADPVLMRCITVCHPDGLYLVGRTMIATHNTAGACGDWLDHAGRHGAAAQGVFFRRRYKDLEGAQRQMVRFFTPLGARWRDKDQAFHFPNGAALRLRHLWDERDADAYQGHEYTWLCFEEAGQWPTPKPVDMLRATLRSISGVKTRLLLTGNPGGAGHGWLKARYITPARNGYRILRDADTGSTRCFIPSRLRDNAILTAADPYYARRLAQTGSKTLVRAWLDGDWDVVAGGAFDDVWNPQLQMLPRFTVPAGWTYRRALDWGSAKPAALGVWAISDGTVPEAFAGDRVFPKGSMVLMRELYTVQRDDAGEAIPNVGLNWDNAKLGTEIARTCDRLTFRESVADPSVWIRAGGPSINEQMMAAAKAARDPWGFVKADNSRLAGWQRMRAMLGQSCMVLPESAGLWVVEDCAEWVRTVPVLQRDTDKPDDVDTEGEDHHGDQTRYACQVTPRRVSTAGMVAVR